MSRTKTIQTLHLAFCLAPSIFVLLSLAILPITINLDFSNVGEEPILVLAPAFALVLIPLSTFLIKVALTKLAEDSSSGIDEKLSRYQTIFIVKSAFLESVALFNTVAFLMTGNLLVLIFAVFAIVILWLSRPTKHKIEEDLKLVYPNTIESL